MTYATSHSVARYVVWEWWELAQSWEPMTLPLSMEDAVDIAALSDAGTCRIMAAGVSPAHEATQ